MLRLSQNSINEQVAYTSLYTLRSLRTPSGGKIFARWISGIFILVIIVLFLPWQQNIRGSGKLTALNPINRPQTIESIIAGRVQKWYIHEGDFVHKGDTIVSISEVKEKYLDPELLGRLNQQIRAKEQSLQSKDKKAEST